MVTDIEVTFAENWIVNCLTSLLRTQTWQIDGAVLSHKISSKQFQNTVLAFKKLKKIKCEL